MCAMTQDSDSSSSSVKELNRMTLPSLKVWPIIAALSLYRWFATFAETFSIFDSI